MSRFSGPQAPGAMRLHRERKRREAEERATVTTAPDLPCTDPETGNITVPADWTADEVAARYANPEQSTRRDRAARREGRRLAAGQGGELVEWG